uniref:Uncharacterized protein n=1 Tax=Amphimedon queenslandica TaxID=400682 RepID=A0A1X7VK25_AMPQE
MYKHVKYVRIAGQVLHQHQLRGPKRPPKCTRFFFVADPSAPLHPWNGDEDCDHALGMRQILTSPYQPSSNGLAEGAVQTFKQSV